MVEITRDGINKALEALKKIKNTRAFSGRVLHNFAMCYLPSPSFKYDWNKVPGEYVCTNCQEKFGSNIFKKEKEACEIIFEDKLFEFIDEDQNSFLVDTWDFNTIISAYDSIKKAGYDAHLYLYCADCVLNLNLPPMVFKFGLSQNENYTISFPDLAVVFRNCTIMEDSESLEINSIEKANQKNCEVKKSYFSPVQYKIAQEYLQVVSHISSSKPDKDVYNWLEEMEKSLEGRNWDVVYTAIEGILGISVQGVEE